MPLSTGKCYKILDDFGPERAIGFDFYAIERRKISLELIFIFCFELPALNCIKKAFLGMLALRLAIVAHGLLVSLVVLLWTSLSSCPRLIWIQL